MLRILLLACVVLAGCVQRPGDAADSTTQGIAIKGSDTMVHLVEAWAEVYRAEHPGEELAVSGGGSGTGIAALLNGTAEACMASRELKPKELELAAEGGVEFEEHVVARDGIAIVVHPENPVQALSMDQLKRVFTGEVSNWSEVGGLDQRIVVLSRETSSGTYVFFAERVLEREDFTHRARLLPSTGAIIQSATQDEGSIGYAGLGYAEGSSVKVVAVVPRGGDEAIVPTLETVGGGRYPISRPLFLYTPRSAHPIAAAFVAFARSDRGQVLVREKGYVPCQPVE